MTRKHKIARILFIIFTAIIIMVVIVIAFISPITKHLIEKYDQQYTGRQITMERAYVNPFTGYIHFNKLKIYELKSDSIFISVDGLSANIALFKLLSKTIEISKLTLDRPKGFIIQKNKDFNFDDLIKKFTVKKTDTKASKVHFNILNIKIKNGEFHYSENHYPINYYIKNVNIESTGKRWNSDTIAAHFSFLSGIGKGNMKGNCTINLKNKNYRLAIVVQKFDLNIIEQYLNDLTNYGRFTANLDADLKSIGNLNDQENMTASGLLAINDFHLGKNAKDDYASFDKLVLAIKEMSPKKHIYLYDSITLDHPYLKYERYDKLDNIQTMFGKNGSNITSAKANTAQFNLIFEIANYVKLLGKNFFQSDFKIGHVDIYKGDIRFNDYSGSEKFAIQLNPINVWADSIDKHYQRVNLSLESAVKPYGNISVALSINPKDNGEFDLQYHFRKFPVAMFNPYIITLTSFPLDRGTIAFNGNWKVRNGIIKSNNHLIIIDPRVSKQIRKEDMKWIPLPLIMSFVRERGNVIDYEIPITGNMKNPKFHIHDVIFDLLGNIFIKPPTTPYGIKVKNIETEIEKSLTLKWEMRQSSLLPDQEKFIEQLSEFLQKNKEAIITVYPKYYTIKEQEYILFFEAKKKYFLASHHKKAIDFNETDSISVDKMSIRDAMFVRYLNKHTKDTLVFTLQEKCALLIHASIVNARFKKLNKEREGAFMMEFKKRDVDKQIKIVRAQNVIPYNGFSFYKISYKGEIPAAFIKAYRQMNELNEDAPRKKYQQIREKNRKR
ncbi:MAG TPA: DUF748 domain-containing protein [Paludibacter sp.]